MVKICYIAIGDRLHSAGITVPISYFKASAKVGDECIFISVSRNPALNRRLADTVGKENFVATSKLTDCFDIVKDLGPNFVFSMDFIGELKVMREIKKRLHISTIVALSALYGITLLKYSQITPSLPISSKLKFLGGKYLPLPFSVISRRYCDLMRCTDYVIAFSSLLESASKLIYGINSQAIIPIPIDTLHFSEPHQPNRNNSILAYVGNKTDHIDAERKALILKKVASYGIPIKLLGDLEIAQHLKKRINRTDVEVMGEVERDELPKIYGSSAWTYVMSEWEGFGLVGPESVLCGTPVIQNEYHGWIEITGESTAVRVARSSNDAIFTLSRPMENHLDIAAASKKLRQELNYHAIGLRLKKMLGDSSLNM